MQGAWLVAGQRYAFHHSSKQAACLFSRSAHSVFNLNLTKENKREFSFFNSFRVRESLYDQVQGQNPKNHLLLNVRIKACGGGV